MRWRIPLSEIAFDVEHKKRHLNKQADALSHLRLLRKTTILIEEDFTT